MRSSMSLSRRSNSFAEAILSKVIEPQQIEQKIESLRALHKTIATLNGSFDLMHAGHLEMIYQASKQADILILALNTDRSIQEYKSPLRPIIPLGISPADDGRLGNGRLCHLV